MTALPDPDYQAEFYASVPSKRLLAWVVDSIVIFLFTAGVVTLTAFTGLLIWPLLLLVVSFAYRTVTISQGSATWGMRFTGIELRNDAGQRLNSSEALLHTAGYTLSLAFPVAQVISVVLMLTSARGQGLSDHLLGTVMLNRRV